MIEAHEAAGQHIAALLYRLFWTSCYACFRYECVVILRRLGDFQSTKEQIGTRSSPGGVNTGAHGSCSPYREMKESSWPLY